MIAVQLFSEFDCNNCPPELRRERGHDEDAPFPYWTDLDGEWRSRCPRLPIFNDVHWFNDTISAYNGYKAGYLPHAGGLMDQNCLFMPTMSLVDHVVDETQKVLEERRRAKDTGNRRGQPVF